MQLRENTVYRLRDGRKVGPLRYRDILNDWVPADDSLLDGYYPMWKPDGTEDFFYEQRGHEYDIVSEWTDETSTT